MNIQRKDQTSNVEVLKDKIFEPKELIANSYLGHVSTWNVLEMTLKPLLYNPIIYQSLCYGVGYTCLF